MNLLKMLESFCLHLQPPNKEKGEATALSWFLASSLLSYFSFLVHLICLPETMHINQHYSLHFDA